MEAIRQPIFQLNLVNPETAIWLGIAGPDTRGSGRNLWKKSRFLGAKPLE